MSLVNYRKTRAKNDPDLDSCAAFLAQAKMANVSGGGYGNQMN